MADPNQSNSSSKSEGSTTPRNEDVSRNIGRGHDGLLVAETHDKDVEMPAGALSRPSSEADDDDSPQDALERSKSTRSIAETMPWYRELLFVAVICLGQLYTRESSQQTCGARSSL